MVIWYILWLFGIFFPFWYFVPKKSGNPELDVTKIGRTVQISLKKRPDDLKVFLFRWLI
jgi:hypothetical protein